MFFVGLGIVMTIPRLLVDSALEKGGKWLGAVEFISGLCIAVVVLVVGYALAIGTSELWDEVWYAFLISAGSLAFVIYFHIAKGEAKRKAEFTPKTAETIVQQYGAALAQGCPDGGIARYESYLPCSKEKIKQAFKLFLAYKIEYKSLTKEPTETLLGAISALNAFVSEEKANRINNSKPSLENEEYWEFTKAMFGLDVREEMDQFIIEIQGFDPDDPLFHQRVYTLIGLQYSPTIEKSYTDLFIESLSGGQ